MPDINPLEPGGRLFSPIDSERPVRPPEFSDRKLVGHASDYPGREPKKNPSPEPFITASEGLQRVKTDLDLLITDLVTLRGQL